MSPKTPKQSAYDELYEKYPRSNGEVLPVSKGVTSKLERYDELTRQIGQLVEEKEKLKVEIAGEIGPAYGLEDDEWLVTWTPGRAAPRYAAIVEELVPDKKKRQELVKRHLGKPFRSLRVGKKTH